MISNSGSRVLIGVAAATVGFGSCRGLRRRVCLFDGLATGVGCVDPWGLPRRAVPAQGGSLGSGLGEAFRQDLSHGVAGKDPDRDTVVGDDDLVDVAGKKQGKRVA